MFSMSLTKGRLYITIINVIGGRLGKLHRKPNEAACRHKDG